MKRQDFSKEALEEAVHNVIKGAKTEQLPSDCPVEPYGENRKLPEVYFSTSTDPFLLPAFILNSSTYSAPLSSRTIPNTSPFLQLPRIPSLEKIPKIFLRLALGMIKMSKKTPLSMKMQHLRQ